MADPDLELRRGLSFVLFALPAFLPSVISSFFLPKITGGGGGKEGGGHPAPPAIGDYLFSHYWRLSVFTRRAKDAVVVGCPIKSFALASSSLLILSARSTIE